MDIAAIEDGFLAALEPLRAEGVRTLDSYAGSNIESIEDIVRLFPAILVVWGGLRVTPLNETDTDVDIVNVLVCDRNLRGEGSARRGDAVSRGVYYWLGRCRALLNRKLPVAGYAPARITGSSPLIWENGRVIIYEQTYEIRQRLY